MKVIKFSTAETCSLKVSVRFNLNCSSSKLCKAQHVRKSEDLLTLAFGGKIKT